MQSFRLSEHIDALFDSGPSCLALLDRRFNCVRVNQVYASTFGGAIEDFVGQNYFDLYPSEARAIFEDVVATRQPFRAEARAVVLPDVPERGVTYWDVTLTPILADSGGVEYLLLSLSDVTGHMCELHRLEETEVRFNELVSHLEAIFESERAHLARELHDELGQALTVIRLGLMATSDASEPSTGISESLRAVIAHVDEAAHRVHRLANRLRPAVLDASGLVAAVEAEAAAWESYGRIQCMVRGSLPAGGLDKAHESALFRIVQEAVTNAVRHAEASLIVVSFRVRGRHVVVTIQDNGRGVDTQTISSHSALGLAGIRERAALVGGTADIHARRRGTTVAVSVPLTTRVESS